VDNRWSAAQHEIKTNHGSIIDGQFMHVPSSVNFLQRDVINWPVIVAKVQIALYSFNMLVAHSDGKFILCNSGAKSVQFSKIFAV
jgi:hypothetical protein